MSTTNNRLSAGRPKDLVKTKLLDQITDRGSQNDPRIFHLAQVIESNDPKKANRLRVRIPIIDDVFYLDANGKLQESTGDDKLPWCMSSSGRFIETPENGSVVLVALLDPQKPHTGRLWISVLNEVTALDIFDPTRLQEELVSTNAWRNAENNLGVQNNNTPGLRDRPTIKSKSKKTNYKTGIRGKNKNKLLLDEKETILVQNEKTRNESKLVLTENALLMAGELSILSSKSSQKFHPVFDRPMWQFLTLQMSLLQGIVTILTTMPGLCLGVLPVAPNPASSSLTALLAQVNQNLTQMQLPGKGASQFLTIN